MIKVIGKKTEESKIYKVVCDKCGVQLECEREDVYEGAYDAWYIKCPECGQDIMVDEIDSVELDEHNIEYPKHFYAMSKDAVDISDERIQRWIRECLTKLKGCEDDSYELRGSGNTMVFAFKDETEYVIYVAKNYAETSITRM